MVRPGRGGRTVHAAPIPGQEIGGVAMSATNPSIRPPVSTAKPAADRTPVIARLVAAIASLGAGAIYLLIGTGVMSVGRSTQEEATTDLFAFGAFMAIVSLAVAIAVWLVPWSRFALIGVAIVELVALIGYVAAAGLREPPFDLWGVLIKVFQATVLVATVYLFAERDRWTQPARGVNGGAA